MKKLTPIEINAAMWLKRNGPFCPGDMIQTPTGKEVKAVLDSLVRKRCAVAEMTDDGPRFMTWEGADAS